MSEPFLGQIVMFGGNFAPRGWALCDGQLLSISSNTALFSILGTTYGGDGRTTFGLPGLRGRVAIHPGSGAGLSTYRLGERAGAEQVQLNTDQIPAHSHPSTAELKARGGQPDENEPSSDVVLGTFTNDTEGYTDLKQVSPIPDLEPDVTLHASSINMTNSNAGGGQGHTNIQPFCCVNFIIAIVGIFPSRN